MDTRIKEILKDLAALDPAFKDERAVRPLVEHLLALAPRGGMDDSFKSRLRRELIATASALPSRPMSAAQFFASWGNMVYAGAGAFAVLLVLFGVFYGPGLFSQGGVTIVAVGERAFGDLTTQGALGMGASVMKDGAESAPTPEGDIAVRSVAPTSVFGMGGGTGAGGPIDIPSPLIYPAPEVPRIDFVYRGDLPEIGDTVDVLRRVKPDAATGGLTTTLRRFAMGLLDLGEFSGANIESFALSEDESFGYTVYVSPAEGTVSIGQNWRRWPQYGVDGPGTMEGTVAMPAEADLVAIASAFLDEYDIDRGNYGDPVVQASWGTPIPLEKMTMPAYIQEIAIVYPYLVDGEPIYDEGGNPTGLYVGVNVKERRVSNVSGLMTRKYESSAYAAERDVEKLLGYAEGRYWAPENARTVVVEVGEPVQGYVNTWTWNGTEGAEVVVPALIFPIPENLNIPNMYFPKNLVVPLAKELIDRNMGGPIRIMSDSVEVMSPPSQ